MVSHGAGRFVSVHSIVPVATLMRHPYIVSHTVTASHPTAHHVHPRVGGFFGYDSPELGKFMPFTTANAISVLEVLYPAAARFEFVLADT